MKKLSALILTLALAASFYACGSPRNYNVVMDGGREITSVGQPEFDEDSKSYKFTDVDGNKVVVPQAQVKVIQEMKGQQ